MRTPAELAFSPDGSRVAFALHATVADVGSFVPSDLFVIEAEGVEPVQLTSGAWSDRTPTWSPDGAYLAFLSDRITAGTNSRTRCLPTAASPARGHARGIG